MLIIATTILLLHLGIMVNPSHFQIRLNFSAASHRTRIKVDPQFIVATIYSHYKTS